MLRRLKTVPKMSLASFWARLLAWACCCWVRWTGAMGALPGIPVVVGGGASCEGGSHFLV